MESGFDTLANFVNQEADYNFASGLELLKKGTGSIGSDLKRTAELLTHAPSYVDAVRQLPDYIMGREVPGVDPSQVPTFEDRVVGGMQEFAKRGRENPEQVAMDFMPGAMGVIRQNMRTPQQIQALRKTIAEEMRSRGPVGTRITADEYRAPLGMASNLDTMQQSLDPYDLILRGTPYHGMTSNARMAMVDRLRQEGGNRLTNLSTLSSGDEIALRYGNETGFLQSLHNSQSMSNKWGEPAGVSTSFLPTKSGTMFSPDEYIHRLLPLYGGPPRERVVNLMEQGGRETLRDAYSGALAKYFNANPEHLDVLAKYARRGVESSYENPFRNFLAEARHSSDAVGKFNLGLSNELQSMGKRGILYNPQRYDEYEMLMLDPKYILPLDYRKWQEFGHPSSIRASRGPVGSVESKTATPGVRKGLEQIQDIMSQNHSRLGDIYSERPWQGYLTPEVKESLLQRVGPDYREQVGNMLEGGGGTQKVASDFDWDKFAGNVADNAGIPVGGSELPGFKNIAGVNINKTKGFSPDTGDLYEDLIDIPAKELQKAFTSFDPKMQNIFLPGNSKWDDLGLFLEEIDAADKGPALSQFLNEYFGVGK